MNHTEQRKRLRAIFAGTQCLSPASVYDALSARVAEAVGYKIGMLAGSTSSSTTLAAPDLIVLTLTEFADQVRRIMRACDLSLIVDADHGYGNALNAMRTVQELEHAGVSCMSIEDTVLPTPFGQTKETLTSIAEGEGKLRAAVAGRSDPSLIIAGRTSALKIEGVESVLARVKAYSKTGVDAIFIVGLESSTSSMRFVRRLHCPSSSDRRLLRSSAKTWPRAARASCCRAINRWRLRSKRCTGAIRISSTAARRPILNPRSPPLKKWRKSRQPPNTKSGRPITCAKAAKNVSAGWRAGRRASAG